MGSIWHKVSTGFAQGPVNTLDFGNGRQAILQTFWTDEDGVTVSIDPGDEPLPCKDVEHLALAMIQMAAVPEPVEAPEDVA